MTSVLSFGVTKLVLNILMLSTFPNFSEIETQSPTPYGLKNRIVNPDAKNKKDVETVIYTATSDGQNPEWNEVLEYILKPMSGA